jgi:hypothetical protein
VALGAQCGKNNLSVPDDMMDYTIWLQATGMNFTTFRHYNFPTQSEMTNFAARNEI